MSPKISKITRKNKFLEALRDKASDPFAVKEGKFKFGQLKDNVYYSDWTEQSFLSDSSRKEVVTRTFNFSKLKYLAGIAMFILAILLGRAGWLQVVKGEYYYLLSEDNRLRAETIEPKRGIIYSQDFKPLVRNKANFVLYFRPIDLPRNELVRDNLLRQISRILEGEPPINNDIFTIFPDNSLNLVSDNASFYRMKEILSTVKIGSLESYQPLFIVDNIEYEKAILLTLELPNWPGVFLSNKIRREYLLPTDNVPAVAGESSLAHILGYTGKINEEELKNLSSEYSPIDYIGKSGLEYFWEKELKGQPGRKNIEVDALGRQKKVINEVPAIDGYNLLLSLDFDLQRQVENIVTTYLKKSGLKRASVIILNPNNGEILALLSWPTYNNNLFAKGISQEEYNQFLNNPDHPLFNRAISGEFPSGSTIKPIFAAGALEEGVINEKTSFLSTGGLRIGEWFFPDWKAGGHGVTNVRAALAWSVNTFFYYIGGGYHDFNGLGLSGLVKYSHLFGLGVLSGIDLSGEADGFVPTQNWKEQVKKEPWYIGDTYHFAIGQGDVLVTPLQVANYTATIANNGTLYKPHLVTKFLGKDNQVVREIKPEIIRDNFIDSDNLKIVREGMRQAVTMGSAHYLNSLSVAVAGKTGTAQWSTQKSPHAWFIGFAPYENPEIVITVLVEEGREGSEISALIAHDVLNWYFSNRY